MKTAIISAHTDDAIFSLGSMIASGKLGEVTIISPFAGIPTDEAGKKKHTILRAEHDKACQYLKVNYINGDFLDDVYGKQDDQAVAEWLISNLWKFDEIYIPLGIHHPDHIFIRDTFLNLTGLTPTGFYEELPYRVLYPELTIEMRVKHLATYAEPIVCKHNPMKEFAVHTYASQVGEHMYEQLFVEERVWV